MMEEVFIGHSVTDPQLFGVRVAGELGGKDQLLQNLAIFQSTYINNRQKILQKQLNKLSFYAGVSEPIEFNKYKIDFESIEASQQLSVELPGVPPYVKEAGGTPSMIKENVLK